MKKYLKTAAIMALILIGTVAVVTTAAYLGAGLPHLMDLDPARVGLVGLAWIALLVFCSVIATVIGGAWYNAAQDTNSTPLRFEAKAGLRRRYSAGELDAQKYDHIDHEKAA